jgi:hypothetical protein
MVFNRSIPILILVVIVSLTGASASPSPDENSPDYWRAGYQRLAALGRGFIVWESNRTGRWRIFRIELDGTNPRQISRDESDRDHYCPHISPDGRRIAYLSYPKDHNTYEAFDHPFSESVPLHLMSADGRFDRVIAPNARAYGEDRGVVWLNDRELVYIDGEYRTFRLNVETGEQTLLLEAPPKGELPRLLDPKLRYATSGGPNFSPYDPNTRTVHWRTPEEGCQPYFSRDGVWGFWMGGAGGPINRYRLDTGQVSPILQKDDPRMPKARAYLYFPMISASGRLFAFAASPNEHDHFTADYDIFVAPIDPDTLALTGDPVRYSFDKGCDRFPDVFLDDSAQAARVSSRPKLSEGPKQAQRPESRNPRTAPGAWPPSRDGLVFLWETGKRPNQIGGAGGQHVCSVLPRGKARLNRHFAMTISKGAYTAEDSNASLLAACKKTNRLTLEATIVPDSLDAIGPARIVTFSSSAYQRNFTLGQEGSRLIFRLRTPRTGENGYNPEVPLCMIEPKRPLHLIVTYTPGELVAYCDGREVLRTDKVQGDFSNWTPQHLLFGDEWNGERPWAGVLEGVAIYNRTLSPDDAVQHAAAYRRLREARRPVPRIEVEAMLIRMSRIPTLKEIRPYKNALALYEYRVAKVISGKYDAKTIRVAHWVILNGETLDAAEEKPGQQADLTLEPFDANSQLASQYLSDSLPENWDLKTYFDIGNP